MLFFGAKWTIQLFRYKALIVLSLPVNEQELIVKRAGRYALCLTGGSRVSNHGGFKAIIRNTSTEQEIKTINYFVMPSFYYRGKLAAEYLHFDLPEGKYTIKLENPFDLRISKPPLPTAFTKTSRNPTFLIKTSMPVFKQIMAIVFLVSGVNMSFWGIYLTINPNPF